MSFPISTFFLDSGLTRKKWKMVVETQKKSWTPNIQVTATCVRVPVLLFGP